MIRNPGAAANGQAAAVGAEVGAKKCPGGWAGAGAGALVLGL